MRSGPVLGFLALIAVAIALAALSSKVHPGGDLPPGEQPDPATQQSSQTKPPQPSRSVADREKDFDQYKAGAVQATLVIAGRGQIVMEFYPKAAPKTVAHITDLIKQGFYPGIKVHRLETFVVQMGDPESKKFSPDQFEANMIGSHGSGTTVPLEANLSHLPFTVGLARSDAPDSGDSQFYINLKDNAELDGKYCVFGRVIQGEDVVKSLRKGDVIQSFTLNK